MPVEIVGTLIVDDDDESSDDDEEEEELDDKYDDFYEENDDDDDDEVELFDLNYTRLITKSSIQGKEKDKLTSVTSAAPVVVVTSMIMIMIMYNNICMNIT